LVNSVPEHLREGPLELVNLCADVLVEQRGALVVREGHDEAVALGQGDVFGHGQVAGPAHGHHQVFLVAAGAQAASAILEDAPLSLQMD
jgi:hypothetical protein